MRRARIDGRVGVGGEGAADVGDEVCAGAGVDADVAVGAEAGEHGVGHGGPGGEVEVAGVGLWRPAREHGGVAGGVGDGCGEVDRRGAGVGGDTATAGDTHRRDGPSCDESAASVLIVDGVACQAAVEQRNSSWCGGVGLVLRHVPRDRGGGNGEQCGNEADERAIRETAMHGGVLLKGSGDDVVGWFRSVLMRP